MRIRIAYATRYRYSTAPRSVVQILRLTPRSHEGQHVTHWRIDMEPDGRLSRGEDPLGNVTHTLYISQPTDTLTITVNGEVETTDTAGVVRGAVERFPDPVYLRQTALTQPNAALRAFAHDAVAAAGPDRLSRLHALMTAVNEQFVFEPDTTDTTTTAVDTFSQRRGVCQDLTHVFLSAARELGLPARYVSGHLAREDGTEQTASHAWAEASVEGLGWIGFDPANGVSPTDRYIRVAVGLDYLGAAPVRGSRYGGGVERLDVKLQAIGGGMTQSQSQS